MFVNDYAPKVHQLRSRFVAEKGVGAVDLLSRFDVRGLAPGRTQWLRLYALLFDGDYEGMLELVKKSEYEYVRDQGLKIIARVCQKRLARITGSNNTNHLLSIEQIWELVTRLLELCTYQECLSVARILRSQKVIAFIESRYADTVVHDLWMYGTPEDMPRDVESFTRASLEGKLRLLRHHPDDAVRLCLEMARSCPITSTSWFHNFYPFTINLYRCGRITNHESLYDLSCMCINRHNKLFKFRNRVARKLMDNNKCRCDYQYPESAEQFLHWVNIESYVQLERMDKIRPKKLMAEISMTLYNKYADVGSASFGDVRGTELPLTFTNEFHYELYKYLPKNVRSEICTRVFRHLCKLGTDLNDTDDVRECVPFIDWSEFYPYVRKLLSRSAEFERGIGYHCFFKYLVGNPDVFNQCEIMTDKAYEDFCESHKGETERFKVEQAGGEEAQALLLTPTEGIPLFMRRILRGAKKEKLRSPVLTHLIGLMDVVRRGSSFEFPIYNCFLECLQAAKNESWIRELSPVLEALLVTNYRLDDADDAANRREMGERFLDCLILRHNQMGAKIFTTYLNMEPLREYLLCTVIPKAMKGRARICLDLPRKYGDPLMPYFKEALDSSDDPLFRIAHKQHWRRILLWHRAQIGNIIRRQDTTEITDNGDDQLCPRPQDAKRYTDDDYLNLLKRVFRGGLLRFRSERAPLSFTEWVKDEIRKNAAKVEFEQRRYIKWLRGALRNDEISDLGEDLKEGGSIYCPYEISAGMSAEDYEGDCYLYWRHNSDLRFVRHLRKVNDDLIQNNRVYQPAIINLSYLITSCSLCDVRDVFQCLLHSNDKPSSGKHVVLLVTRVLANPVYYLLAIVNMTMAHPHTRAAAMKYLKPYMFGAAYIKPLPNRLTHGSIIAALTDNPDTCTKTLNEFDKLPSRPGSRSLDTQVSEMKMPEIPEMNVDKIWDSIKTDNLTDNDILLGFLGSTLECPNEYSDRYYHLIFQMLDPSPMSFQSLLINLRYGNHPKNDRTLVEGLLARIDLTSGYEEELVAVFVIYAPTRFKFMSGKSPNPNRSVPFDIHRSASDEGTLMVYLDSISASVLDAVVKLTQFNDLKNENALTLIGYISQHEYSLRLLYDLFEAFACRSGKEELLLELIEVYFTQLNDHDMVAIVLMAANNKSSRFDNPQHVFDLATKLSKSIGPLKTTLLYGLAHSLATHDAIDKINAGSAESPSVYIRNVGAFECS
ncbi:hypothetical protein GNI_079320 [Gregarina niphandrodes]|uniref:Uncharacterized protein n=1 Tax=Gregarina niphandrodes TaxID=110365 RepID=A0A023B6J0_GRENI|nr:hypothetical protein GNI_079320 [Gregarina niphandrodes]EZG66562.1 hypothetical protein GNI_079320 [Gregarina niphandrodes]|eukprot:XP_011130604.1 hypothetical protein GNI_079320 [Gregarina niphandrodes]